MTTLSLNNFKGSNEKHELGKVNLLVGGSGTGKSTVIQALTFLTAGYLTDGGEVYKKPEEIFKLASADEMSAILTNEMGTYERGIVRSSKVKLEGTEVKYTRTADVSNKFGEKTATQLSDRITSDFGMHDSILNFSSFTKLSAEEQKKFIFSIYPVDKEKWTQEAIKNYLVEKLAGNFNDAAEAIVDQLVDVCVNKSVNEAIEMVKKQYNELNADKGKLEIAMQELLKIKQQDEESVRGLAVAEKNQKEYSDKIGTLSEDLQKANTHNSELSRNAAQLETLKTEIDSLKNEIEVKRIAISDNRKLIIGLSEDADPQSSNHEVEIKKLESEIFQLDTKVKELDIKKTEALGKVEEQEKLIAEQKELCTVASGNVSKASEIIEGLKVTFQKLSAFDGSCPLSCKVKCGTDMSPAIADFEDEIERNRLLLNELQSQDKAVHDKLNEMTGLLEQVLNPRYLEASKVHSDFVDALNELENELQSHIIERNKMIEKIDQSFKKRSEEISEIEKTIAKLETSVDWLNQSITDKVKESKAINEDVREPIDVPLIESDIEVFKQHLNQVNAQIKEKVKAKTNLENLANSEKTAAENLEKWQTYKLVREALGSKGLAGQMITDAILPMISGIQHNLNCLIGGVEFYVDNANFNFGWIVKDEKRSFETLSGGETLIIATAMAIEFMQKTCRYKMLLVDEINHADTQLADRFIKGMVELQDKYDLCVMAANFTDEEQIHRYASNDRLNVINLSI